VTEVIRPVTRAAAATRTIFLFNLALLTLVTMSGEGFGGVARI
jgi:hypothetical protein